MAGGRPTDYLPEYCEQLITHMASGLSYESFAGKISCALSTLYEWEKANPEFSEAKKAGFEKNRLFYEEAGVRAMQGEPINATVWIYNMKCRFRKEWTEVNKVEANITGEVKVKHIAQLLDGLSPETLQIVEAELEQKQITGGTE